MTKNEKRYIELATELTISSKPVRDIVGSLLNESPATAAFTVARMAELLLDPKAPGRDQRKAAWERLCGFLAIKAA